MPSLRPTRVALLAFTSFALLCPASASAAGECDQVAAPGAGAAQRLVDSLGAGQTGCLRAGTYREAVRFNRGNLTLRPYPGEQATVIGRMLVPQGSDGVTVEGLYLDGTNPNILPSPSINARNTTFVRNDVTNNHTAICFSLGHPTYGRATDTKIELNRIHNCGVLPAANHDHGIYVTSATNTTITNNWIYDNADRGIQLYPDAQNTTITNNVIDGNGTGIIFSGDFGTAANNNTVNNNIITNSNLRSNVESFYPAGNPTGTNNTVHHNCIKGGARDNTLGGVSSPQIGFVVSENLAVDPQFANRAAKDFRPAPDSPCRGLLASSAVPGPDAPTPEPTPTPTPEPTPTPTPEPTPTPTPEPTPTPTPEPTPTAPSDPTPTSPKKGRGRKLTLKVSAVAAVVQASGRGRLVRLRLRGQLRGASAPAGHTVVITVKLNGRWRAIARVRVSRSGRFTLRRAVRLPRGMRSIPVRATAAGSAVLVLASVR
jgi:parallel beta-helix repeat protein